MLSWDEIRLLYRAENDCEIGRIYVQTYGNHLLLEITGYFGNQVYFSPLDDGVSADFVDADDLFTSKSGGTEEIVYGGMVVERQYNTDEGNYVITKVVEEENGRSILKMDKKYIKVDGKEVSLWKERGRGRFWYCVEGSTRGRKISCLEGGRV